VPVRSGILKEFTESGLGGCLLYTGYTGILGGFGRSMVWLGYCTRCRPRAVCARIMDSKRAITMLLANRWLCEMPFRLMSLTLSFMCVLESYLWVCLSPWSLCHISSIHHVRFVVAQKHTVPPEMQQSGRGCHRRVSSHVVIQTLSQRHKPPSFHHHRSSPDCKTNPPRPKTPDLINHPPPHTAPSTS